FFQAEDGIRDFPVTGVQTCALPISIVQNTRPCRASALATNCTRDTAALKENTSAMPNSTSPDVLIEPQRATASSSSAETSANTKALAAIVQDWGTPGSDRPSTMAIDAPNAAAEEIPSVKGLASGLFRMVCISPPARPRASPTATAIRA